jgi:uncharacterized membrane protein YgdD (TMEM256/DUF423 family)
MGYKWIAVGSFLMALAVALGAMGAHALKGQVSDTLLESYKTGVLYHMIHALAIIAVGIISAHTGRPLMAVGYMFVAGIVFFSGSIYILSTREISGLDWKFLGPITPVGGLLFMAAWVTLGISLLRGKV